jgi:hypothetical protein
MQVVLKRQGFESTNSCVWYLGNDTAYPNGVSLIFYAEINLFPDVSLAIIPSLSLPQNSLSQGWAFHICCCHVESQGGKEGRGEESLPSLSALHFRLATQPAIPSQVLFSLHRLSRPFWSSPSRPAICWPYSCGRGSSWVQPDSREGMGTWPAAACWAAVPGSPAAGAVRTIWRKR